MIAPHSVSYAANNAVDGQLIALENELTRLDELANQDNALTDIEVLITSLPVSEESLPSKVLQLKQQTLTLTAIQSQISQLEKLMYKLDASKSHLNKRLSALSEAEITLSQSKKKLAAIVQILSNPKNNEELPIERLGKPRQLSEKLQRLTREYGAQIEDLSLQSQALDNAIETLSQWKGALSQALIAKRNQQNQTINTELLDGRKDVLLDKINMLQHDLINVEKAKNIEEIEQLQKAIYENEMMLWLANHREQLLSLMNASALSLSKESLSALPLSDLEAQKDALLDLQEQLQALSDELSEHKEKYAQHVAIVGANTDIENTFNEQQKAIAYQQLLLVPLSERLGTLISDKKQAALLSIDLLYREQQFKRAWTGISKSLVQIGYQIQISLKTLLNHILAKPIQTLLLALIGLAILVAGLRLLKHWLTAKPAQFSNTVRVSFKTLKLWLVLRRNSLLLLILFFGIILIRVSDIPYPSNHIIRALIYAPCFLALWLSLIHLEFRQKIYTASQSLIHIVASVIMVVFCFLYAVSSMSSIDAYVLSLYEKGLMLAVAYFAWIERHHLSQYFFKRQSGNHRKFYRLLLKTINLLPWVVISICAISLIGYSRLAWQLFTYLGIGIGYFLCIFIGISLINSWRKQAKLSALKRFEHGAFVASDIVSPLSTIAKLLWIWLISALLFYLMKWDSDTFLINKFLGFFQYPLLSIGKTVINLQILALSCLAIYAIFKVARWLKTFSYHWLYARIHDLGIRGSLSIFTQYVATFIGVLIALNVLGIDLTSLTVFAGALGVGVGLGLQDIAKNFVSGILLLIERPLRNGDWVDIDGSEGTVKSIGMRAITMETFDGKEVIIPNSSAISNSFINNTHSDSLLRTILYVGAGYDSDPNKVLGILQNILESTEHVLSDPAPRSVLWEYGDSSINYRIQYYVNIDEASLLSVRTVVLSQIWHVFKENNIEIPYPQRDLNVKTPVSIISYEDK